MKILLTLLESTILLSLLGLLGKGLMAGDLQMIVPATVILSTLGPLVVFNNLGRRETVTDQPPAKAT